MLVLSIVGYRSIPKHILYALSIAVFKLITLVSEMFKILERSELDIDILSWVWDQVTTVTFVTTGLKSNDNGTFSKEQGIVALYLAQVQSGLELNQFSRELTLPHDSPTGFTFFEYLCLRITDFVKLRRKLSPPL
jgi:hypothetical protein